MVPNESYGNITNACYKIYFKSSLNSDGNRGKLDSSAKKNKVRKLDRKLESIRHAT